MNNKTKGHEMPITQEAMIKVLREEPVKYYYSALVSATDTDVTQEIEVNIYILADNKQQAEEKGDAIAEQVGEVTGFTQVQIAKDQ
jgi:hypothetical protein|tara:strand:+ start:712 stop:969 length:258 start_codon:yes stop_codon:yes gene_type:complete